MAAGLVRIPEGAPPGAATRGLFHIHSCPGHAHKRPRCAYLAVYYRDHWFYVDDHDSDSKITFSLVLMMTRVNLLGVRKGGPTLTLPVGH